MLLNSKEFYYRNSVLCVKYLFYFRLFRPSVDADFILCSVGGGRCVANILSWVAIVWKSTQSFQEGRDGRFLKYTREKLEINTKFWFETSWNEHLEDLVMYEANTLLYERNTF
jgi:hypothetical protein